MARCSWLGSWGRRLSAPLEVRQASLPLARYHKIQQAGHRTGQNVPTGVGFGSGVCIAINLVMGSGFLALPKAFVSTGLVLGTLVLFVSMALLSTTAGYEMEVMCRADTWVNANVIPLMHKQCSQEENGGGSETMCLGTHAYQVSEMCEMFGGRTLQRVYNVLLFFYVFCTLWGFAAIFGEAFATYAPLPFLDDLGAYRFYVMVFSVVMVPMSCLNIKEQALFQVVLTVFRFIALFTMVGSIIASLHMGEHPFGPASEQFIGTVELFRWRGFFQAVPPAIFALSLASTVPTLVSGLEDKHSVRMVTWTALISAAITYTSFSLAAAYYFGVSVDGSCNVNWEHYRPGDGGSGSPFLVVFGRVVAYFVVFFPALDVMSVYPLDVMVVANNMMVMVYNDHVDEAQTDPVVVMTFRVACAVPPLLCALLIRNFSEIVNYGGSLTIMIALVIPAYLNLISKKQCEERFGRSRTAFTGDIFSSTPVLRACILLGAVLFVSLALNDVASLLVS